MSNIFLTKTIDYGTASATWRAVHLMTPIHLTQGKHKISFGVVKGYWNYDWIYEEMMIPKYTDKFSSIK